MPRQDNDSAAGKGAPAKTPKPVRIRIQTYGTCTVEVGGFRLGRNADVVVSILLLLTHSPNMQLPRDSMLELLWPESPEKRQRGNLRQALYKLRLMGINATMNGDQVVLDQGQIEKSFTIRRDIPTFEALVLTGQEPFGQFLAGYDAGDNAYFAEWIENERERANSDARRVLSMMLNVKRESSDWIAAEPLARWLLQFDPLNEAATLAMSECLLMSGAKYEAIRLLDRYMSELGPDATDLRIPAATLRRRIASPTVRRISFAPTERHFVGRETVMAELSLCMRRGRHREGTATLLHGSAGMGKTRVLNELTKMAVLEGVRDVRTGCRETDVSRPLSVFLEMVPDLLQMPGALGCSPENLIALRRFVNDDSVESDRAANGSIANMPLAAGLRRSIVDLIAAVAEEKPMLFVVEDVHWLDAASWEVIVDLIDRISQLRVCLILTSRLPHARPVQPQRQPVDLVIRALQPLSFESRLDLVHAIATDLAASIDDELADWFVHSCEGVPLFLRSLVNHWIETGDAGGVPPTLQNVIGQRVQNLSTDAAHVLQTVTLLGRHATLAMIESVLELPSFRVIGAIDELHKAGAFDNDLDGIVVCHELIGRMATDGLGRTARRLLHKRIADLLAQREDSEGISPGVCRDRLGHLLDAGEPNVFLAAAIRAISLLFDGGFYYDALGVCDLAVQHVSDPHTANTLLSLQSKCLYACAEFARLLAHPSSPASLRQGLSKWEDQDPEALLRWIDSAAYAGTSSDTTELAATAVGIAESIAKSAAIRFSAASLALRITSNCCDEDLARRAHVAGLSAAIELDRSSHFRDEIDMLYHACFGNAQEGAEAALRIHARLLDIPHAADRLSVKMRVAYALRCAGRIDHAKDLYGQIHLEAKAANIGSMFSFAAWRLSLLHLDFGDIATAHQWAREFDLLAPVNKEPLAAMIYHNHKVRMTLAIGDTATAKHHHELAGRCMPEHGHLIRLSAALSHKIAIARQLQSLEELGTLIPQSIEVFAKTCNAVGQAFFASELAMALHLTGDINRARHLLAEFMYSQRREPGPYPKFLLGAAAHVGLEVDNNLTGVPGY